ncbi:uncharacterized protein [Bemisia tabaci]|uniref:uncharacterized protein isoform X2 n=1 Tax=Bemisia tabaci TaxID=7038 RepID=UPI0008F9E2B2|nr:PREDICTED: uncharacterized protein LOC109044129 [Bemisia tabaci]
MKLPNELVTDMKLMSSILDRSSSTYIILLGSKIGKEDIRPIPDSDAINEEDEKDTLACQNLSNLLSRIQISDKDSVGITKVDDLISRSPARSSVNYKKTSRQSLQPYPAAADPHHQRLAAIKTGDCYLTSSLLAQDLDSCEIPLTVLEHLEDANSNCDVLQEPGFIEQFSKHVEDHLQSTDLVDPFTEFMTPAISRGETKNYINLSNSCSKAKGRAAVPVPSQNHNHNHNGTQNHNENHNHLNGYAVPSAGATGATPTPTPADSYYLPTSLNIPLAATATGATAPTSGSDGEECNSADTWAFSSATNKVSSSPSSWCSTLSTSPSRHSAAYPSPSWGSTADPSPSPCEPVSSPPLNIFSSFTTSTSSYIENPSILNSPHSSSSSPPTSILSPRPRSAILPPQMNGDYDPKIYPNSSSIFSLDDNTIFTSPNSEPTVKHHQSFYPETKSVVIPCASSLPLNIYGAPPPFPPPAPPHPGIAPPQASFNKPPAPPEPPQTKSPLILELPEKNSSEYQTNNNNINVHNNNTCGRKQTKKKPGRESTFTEIQPDGPVVRDEDMVVPGRIRIEKMLQRILRIAAIAETFIKNPNSIYSDLIDHLKSFEPKRERGKLEKIYACIERLKREDLSRHLEEYDTNGMTLLYYAALECHKFPVIPRYIADSIVDVNRNPDQSFAPDNNSLLHILAGLGGSYLNVLAELLNVRNSSHVPIFNLNKQNSNGHTPLHSAVLAHHPPLLNSVTVVKILVKYGANLDAQDHNGQRPLHLAILSSCDPVLIKILLQKGSADTVASLNSVDLNGDTPLHLAAGKNDLPLSVQKEVIKQLTDKGAVSKSNQQGHLPVHFLAFDRKQELQALLQRKK